MKQAKITLVSLAALLALSGSQASGDVLDQSVSGPTTSYYSDINKGVTPVLMETFTAGISGTLSRVNLPVYEDLLYNGSTPIGLYNSGITVSILDANFNVLGTVSVPSTDISPISAINPASVFDLSVDVSGLGIQVTAGQQYAVGVTPTTVVSTTLGGNGLDWVSTANTYAGGEPLISYAGGTPGTFFSTENDLEFQTYVSTGNTLTLQGGTPQVPVIISTPGTFARPVPGEFSPLSQLTSNGGAGKTNQFYQFYWTGGNFSVHADVYGASILNPSNTGPNTIQYTLELLQTNGSVIESVNLNLDNLFNAALAPRALEPLPAGEYIVGVFGTDPVDPTISITFDTPIQIPQETLLVQQIRNLEAMIAAFPSSAFKSPALQEGFKLEFDAVLITLQIKDYKAALLALQDLIVPEVDGCATNGSPAKDWINNCSDESMVYTPLLNIIAEVKALATPGQ
jgi:hypothetical protein